MEETNYTKRELDHFFVELNKRMDHQDGMLSEIKIQTLKTNGRVTKGEFWITALKWMFGIVWTIVLVLAPILWHAQQLQSKQDAEDAVTSALSAYNIQVK